MSESEQDDTVAVVESQDERRGPERVVLCSARAVVLDDLSPSTLRAVLDALDGETEPIEVRYAVAVAPGSADEAIRAVAGKSGEADCIPGTWYAPPKASWFASGTVTERPPLG